MENQSSLYKAASLLSTPPSELEKPPAEVETEGQEAPAKVEETTAPEASEAKQETPKEAKAEGDTEAEVQKFKVKVDGQELEVDLDELTKGYSRESHYQKKAKDLAQERDEITNKASELDAMLSDAELLINDKKARLDSQELKDLREDDPDAYLREVEKLEKEIGKFESMKEKRAKEWESKNAELVAKEREALMDAFPTWSDEAVMNQEAAELFKTLEGLGFTQDEMNNITDHRLFILASKAKQLDEIQSADLETKKVKTETKTLEPNAAKTADTQSSAKKNAWDKLKKTGKLRDAAALLSTT